MTQHHDFDFSQNTFHGSLACNSIATLIACSFADGTIDQKKFKYYTQVGSHMWQKVTGGSKTTSAKEIIDAYDFFRNTYDIDEYQGYYANDIDGRISIKDLIATIKNENGGKSVGIVFTDGCISFAVGKFNNNWVIFDSHAPHAWIKKCSIDDIVENITKNFVLPNVFDATTIIKR